jgi:hypothetical protein
MRIVYLPRSVLPRNVRVASREEFKSIQQLAVIPTFDPVIEYGDLGVIVCKRRIAPYRGVWALPGLRMLKPESIEDTVARISQDELGLELDPAKRVFLGQYAQSINAKTCRLASNCT